MQDLEITLVQFDIEWQNPDANKKAISDKVNSIETTPDLIVLPEMFTTGFTMEVNTNAEQPEGKTLDWMRTMAITSKAVITGSIIVKEDDKFYNRLFWVNPNGDYTYYNKRHLFRMANEHHFFSDGNMSPIFELKEWKIKPLICYDLRFPVWSRNTNLDYDLVLYVANWPQARISAWDTLLKARAIENLSYSLGVNRVGIDGTGKEYNGHSAVYDFKGDLVSSLSEKEELIPIKLSKTSIDAYRKSFPANLDADIFIIPDLI
jgi:omega-amidase